MSKICTRLSEKDAGDDFNLVWLKLMADSVEMAKIRIVVQNLSYRGRCGQISFKIEIALYKYTPQSIELSEGRNAKILMKTANNDISKSQRSSS